MTMTTFTIAVRAHNCTSIVMRVLGLFQRRRLDFAEMHISRPESEDEMTLTLQVSCTKEIVEKVLKKIQSIIDVFEVSCAPVRLKSGVEFEAVPYAATNTVGRAGGHLTATSMTLR